MDATPESARDVELSRLVELEARWENLRGHPAPLGGASPRQALGGIQKAYESFHDQLVSYNRRHTPPHTPELLLNTPRRLGRWCATMADLFRRVEAEPNVRCPVHLVEKAYRRAEGVARRWPAAPDPRRPPPETIRAAVEDLEALGRWCDALLPVSADAAPPVPGAP